MSRYKMIFNEPKEVLGYTVDEIAYGLDHATGYFISGFLNDELVFDRDSYGFGLADNPDSADMLGNMELSDILRDLGRDTDANLVAMDFPPVGA